MSELCTLFEGLDLLDLWQLYSRITRVSEVRQVSTSKVSRRTHDFLSALRISSGDQPGIPKSDVLQQSACLRLMRLAYQQWRLDQGWLKVLPTFTANAGVQALATRLDLLPDVSLDAEALAHHLMERRLDLVVSSSLDLAGELIADAQTNPGSPFCVVPLFSEPVMLAVNPAHPLAKAKEARVEDCLDFPSPGYPEGVARLAAEALSRRGLWRYASKRPFFEVSEWMLGMRSPTGLCYVSGLLLEGVPECQELAHVPFAEPLGQTTSVVMLKEIANTSAGQQAVGLIRDEVLRVASRLPYAMAPISN